MHNLPRGQPGKQRSLMIRLLTVVNMKMRLNSVVVAILDIQDITSHYDITHIMDHIAVIGILILHYVRSVYRNMFYYILMIMFFWNVHKTVFFEDCQRSYRKRSAWLFGLTASTLQSELASSHWQISLVLTWQVDTIKSH